MSLRTTALIAGVIGVLLLIAGLVADAQRPARDVQPTAAVDTAVVVYEPAMIAFVGEDRLAVSGDGDITALTARPADAEAWLAEHAVTVVTGLPDWEQLSTSTAEPVEPSPSPSASPSASAAEAEPSPSPSPSASDGAQAEEAEPVDLIEATSQDHWRERWNGTDRLSINAAQVPAGETLVIVSRDGSPLTSTDIAVTRDVQDGWITPLIWWGAFLTLVGVVALVLRFIDLRPAQARSEEWIAKRQRVGEDDDPEPGSRRARREAGEHLPETSLDEDAVVSASSAPSASSPGAAETPSAPSEPSAETDGEERP